MSEKVLLIVVDGMRPDSIQVCGDPDFESFFKSGTYTFSGKTVYPPVTLPAHMSLFHSVDPGRHGVYTNVYVPQNHPIAGLVETLKAAGKKSAFFYTWEQLRDLCTPGGGLSCSWFMNQHSYTFPELERRVTDAAKEQIRDFRPDFAFLYLGGVDEFGHQYGWMSEEYLQDVKSSAACIYDICASLPEEYSVIVTADHGGHNRNHGDDVPEDMMIPAVFKGPRFPCGRELASFGIKDVAPTILDILNVAPNPEWEGRSILR
jgi:predicted AlkP superfamily pyrophosphatase or phosphodiesterase